MAFAKIEIGQFGGNVEHLLGWKIRRMLKKRGRLANFSEMWVWPEKHRELKGASLVGVSYARG